MSEIETIEDQPSGLERIRQMYRGNSALSIIMMLLLLVPLIFIFSPRDGYETPKLTLWALGTGLALILVVVKGGLWRVPKAVLWGSGAWVLWFGLSTIFSMDRVNSLIGFYPRFTNSLLFALLCALSLIVMVAVLHDAQKKRIAGEAMLLAAAGISIVGILQSYGVGYYEGIAAPALARAPSLLGNPNFSSMFVAALIPYALLALWNAGTVRLRWYYGIVSLLCLFSLTLLSSRGSLVGLGAGLVFVGIISFLYQRKHSSWFKKQVGVAIVGLIAIAALTGIYIQLSRPDDGAASAVTFQDNNSVTRVVALQAGITAVRANPFFGTGPGNFALFYERNIRSSIAGALATFDDTHNLPLLIAATAGIPALLIFLIGLIYAGLHGLRRLTLESDWFTLAILGGIATVLVATCFNPVPVAIWQLLVAFMALLIIPTSASGAAGKNFWRKIIFPAGWILGALVLITWAILFFSSELVMYSGINLFEQHNYIPAIRRMVLVTKLNPWHPQAYSYLAQSAAVTHNSAMLNFADKHLHSLHPLASYTYQQQASLYFLEYIQTGDRSKIEKSLQSIDQALTIDPSYVARYPLAAYIAYSVGDYDRAAHYMYTDLSLNPTDVVGWSLLAKIEQARGRRDQMVYALEQAFKLAPTDPQLRNIIGIAQKSTDVNAVPIRIVMNGIPF